MNTGFPAALAAIPFLVAAASAQDAVVSSMAPGELRGDWVIGATVTSPQDETIGRIVDVIIDTDDGAVSAAVITVGGFLGFGGKQIAVEWQELDIDYDGREITLALTRDEADAAEAYMFRDQDTPPPPAPATGTGMAPAGGGTTGGSL